MHHPPAYKWYYPLLKAAAINGVLFIFFVWFANSVYDSLEDVFVLSILSGDYSGEPSAFLHYRHLMHPLLGSLIAQLFRMAPEINWYTVLLLAAHYIAFTAILYILIREGRQLYVYVLYFLIWILFDCYFLLTPDFTGAAIALGCAGMFILFNQLKKDRPSTRTVVTAVLLFALGASFRIHALIPLSAISLVFILFHVRRRNIRHLAVALLSIGVLIIALDQSHVLWYKSLKPGWTAEEAYRQKLFRFFNEDGSIRRPQPGEKWADEWKIVREGIIVDTTTINGAELESMYQDLKQAPDIRISGLWLKWFFINNRIYLAGCLILIFACYAGLRSLIPPAVSFMAIAAAAIWLLSVAKLPYYIIVSALQVLALMLLSQAGHVKRQVLRTRIILGLSGLMIAWGCWRLVSLSNTNLKDSRQLNAELADMAKKPGEVFLVTGTFHLKKMNAWSTPASLPRANYAVTEHFVTGEAGEIYKKANRDQSSEPVSNEALVWGTPDSSLQRYFEKVAGRPIRFEGPLKGFSTGKVYRVHVIE